MSKPNLVILHSFPTNSILLQGLKEYLSDFFEVYIIDLPGFVKTRPPLKVISIENYAHYVESKIDSLHLNDYILCGISFGFILLLSMNVNPACKGILAIEPYIGRDSLNSKKHWRYTLAPFISLIDRLHLIDIIWKNSFFRHVFTHYLLSDLPSSITTLILNEIDGKTFMRTLYIILTTEQNYNFHSDIPHVLMINKRDSTLNESHMQNIFKKHVKKMMVIESNMPHFPKDLSKTFFSETFSQQEINKALSFLSNSS